MSSTTDPEFDPTELIEQHFPYDGPHSPESATDAARAITALVDYLNNATGAGNDLSTLRYASTASSLLVSLRSTTDGLDQVLDQVGGALSRNASDPTLYDDRRGEHLASDTASAAASATLAARQALAAASSRIGEAASAANHLGHNIED